MRARTLSQLRIGFTLIVTLATLAHLLWQHVDGGVPSHHLLHRADLPSVSNWWSLLLLPSLSWFLIGRAGRRISARPEEGSVAAGGWSAVAGFASALLMGSLISVSFAHGHESMTSYAFFGTILLALLLPAYRAECLLGFVLGMAWTFGGVLPAIVGSVIATVSAVVHLYVVPTLVRFWRRLGSA